MSPVKKKFVLTHTVKNIFSLKENESNFSEEEEHYGVPWKMRVSHYPGFLGFHLFCNYPKNKGTWSIRVNFEMKLTPKTGKSTTVTATGDFSNDSEFTGWGRNDFRKWEEIMNDSLIDDVFFIEVHAKIIEMTGIEQKKLRNFDESVKQFSDVVLIVNDEKFYVSKLVRIL
uniref:MATH domain-containing protein n=1 Tax=Caenorhabditis tropicalis TaxID=1561998 RepID=A0A1I7TGN7_9PELO